MDKDNLNFQRVLNDLTKDTLISARAEMFQQLISTLCLTAVGLFLASVGLLGLVLKLLKFAIFNLLFLVPPIALLLAPQKIDSKSSLGVANK